MITIVEGISAAGKTTWCAQHGNRSVPEVPGITPPASDAMAVARFWAEAQCQRWTEALKIESELGRVYFDTDPIKLHYSWGLWRIGEAPKEDWLAGAAAYRECFAAHRLGFGDAVVFLAPPVEVVRRQKEGDASRSRRNFERHLQLGPTLREWYEILEQVSPGRVRWHGERLADVEPADHSSERFSLSLFDAIVAAAS